MIVSFELLGQERELFDFDGFCSPIELHEDTPEAAIVSSVEFECKKRGSTLIQDKRETSFDVGKFKSVDYIRPQDEFALYGQFLESTFRVRDFKIEIIRGMLETLSLSPRAIVGNVDSFVDALLFLEQNGSEAEHLELVPRFGQWLNHPVVAFHFGRHYAKIFEEELKELKMNEQRELAEGFIDLFKELPKAAFYISGSVIRASRLLKR